VRIRDVLKCREWFANAMAAVDDVIITADNARFIERFDGEGWNPARTRLRGEALLIWQTISGEYPEQAIRPNCEEYEIAHEREACRCWPQ